MLLITGRQIWGNSLQASMLKVYESCQVSYSVGVFLCMQEIRQAVHASKNYIPAMSPQIGEKQHF